MQYVNNKYLFCYVHYDMYNINDNFLKFTGLSFYEIPAFKLIVDILLHFSHRVYTWVPMYISTFINKKLLLFIVTNKKMILKNIQEIKNIENILFIVKPYSEI